ncbi:MAG: thermostable hemolysin, partial [Alphaproteobacteria bacterium]|nr:thermostable hemolysin [Alphaproteobacteria bacterium]
NGHLTGQLSLDGGPWLKRMTARPSVISVMPAFTQERQAVEDFIINIYAQSYGAQIGVHYPILMSVRDDTGKILAALGFRYAQTEPLFLEQYLARPVEDVLHTPRQDIVEIGNLASAGGGASLFLFAALSAYLEHRGMRFAVITGTGFIEKRLRSLGLRPRRLAPADPSRLLQKDENWGRYYDTAPHVLAGDIDEGYRKLQHVLGAAYTQRNPRLFPRLHYRGEN